MSLAKSYAVFRRCLESTRETFGSFYDPVSPIWKTEDAIRGTDYFSLSLQTFYIYQMTQYMVGYATDYVDSTIVSCVSQLVFNFMYKCS